MKTTALRYVLKPLASLELEEGNLMLKLTRTSDPLYPIEKDKFLTTYANDDAYGLMDRYLSFTRAVDGNPTPRACGEAVTLLEMLSNEDR